MDVQDIIIENGRRLAELNSPYNPITGEGSPVPRTLVRLSDLENDLYLPDSMVSEPWVASLIEAGSIKHFSKLIGRKEMEVHEMLMHERFRHDFEFWALLTIIIQDKISLEPIPFLLRKAQLILLAQLEDMRLRRIPIRIILLKARQWGGSTLLQFYMMWIQQIHKKNWHLAICAQDDGAANNIGEMYKRACENYPKEVATITFKPYAKSPKNTIDVKRGGIIGVGSINNPDQFRSYNYPMIHISEAGLWQDTSKRTTARLVQSLRSTVPRTPYSMVVIESTAKGVGNFFHSEWLAASKKKSGYAAVFVPWFKIDIYQSAMDPSEYEEFISMMTEHDKFAWAQGATLEGIKWYNEYQFAEKYEDSQMYEEYPTTPEEAFISTGTRVIPYTYIVNARTTVRPPLHRGEIYPVGIADKTSLEKIEFHSNKTGGTGAGGLRVWKMPEPYITLHGKKYLVLNRYCGFADIGGINPKADFSCLKVLDRLWMLWGGVPETAAMWHGHLDQDLFAWKCAQVGTWYNKMLLAIETNSLKKEKAEGDYFVTVLDNIAPHYDNLYIRNNHESTNTNFIPKYGFHTGHGNKDMIMTSLLGVFRGDVNGHPLYNERDEGSLDECDFYERKPDGSMGAVEGKKDDRVIITAGSVWLATKYMDPPVLVPYIEPNSRAYKSRTIISEASM
jgi:hypothetical protein